MDPILKNIYGFFLASRIPNLMIIFVTQFLTGYFLLSFPLRRLISFDFGVLVLTTIMIAAAGYIINDYYDQKIDMVNRPKKVVVGVILKRRLALISHTLLNFGAIGLAFLVDPLIALVHFLSAFGLWFYSNHLRRLPFLGNLTIGLLTGMILLIVAIFFRVTDPMTLIYALFAFLVSFTREIIKDIEDVKGEAAFGCSTIPVIWGIRGAKIVVYLASGLGIILLGYYLVGYANEVVQYFFLALSPVYIWFIYKVNKADTQEEFHSIHRLSNFIILFGLLSIVLIDG